MELKRLHDIRGDYEHDYYVVEVNEENNDLLEDIMCYYDDTCETLYDDDDCCNPYSIMKSKDGYDCYAVQRDDWEEWLNNHD